MEAKKFEAMTVSEMQNVDGGSLLDYLFVKPIPVMPILPIMPIIKKFLIWC